MSLGLLVMVVACSTSRELDRQATEVAAANQPRLAALVDRIRRLQREVRGDADGWETMLRTAELANDELGLPPFTQRTPPAPAWHASPATLLGIEAYVRGRAHELAALGSRRELRDLVDDERRRYDQGIASVDAHLAEVERWLERRSRQPGTMPRSADVLVLEK